MTLQELANQYLGADQDDVAEVARRNFGYIVDRVGKRLDDPKAGMVTAIKIFASFVAADGKIAQDEWVTFQYIFQTEMGDDEAKMLLEQCEDKDIYDFAKTTMKAFDDEMRKNIIVFGLAVCAIDKCFSQEEFDYVLDLIKLRESM